MLRLKI